MCWSRAKLKKELNACKTSDGSSHCKTAGNLLMVGMLNHPY